jgi:hypothetical protein
MLSAFRFVASAIIGFSIGIQQSKIAVRVFSPEAWSLEPALLYSGRQRSRCMQRLGLFLLFLTCIPAFGQLRLSLHRDEQARAIVNSYCRMDYEGFRLLKDSWPRMKSLTTWKDNPDWKGFTVVSQYELSAASVGLRAATVGVHYVVLGRFQAGLGYTAEPGSEEVSFRLKDVDSAWKIEDLDPTINPHVSKPRAIAWLKAALAAEKDAANRIALQKALQDLGASP